MAQQGNYYNHFNIRTRVEQFGPVFPLPYSEPARQNGHNIELQ